MKITKITKIENNSKRYDIQTTTQNFFIDSMLVHNSMISPVLVDGKVQVKSKKAFTSDVAVLAQAFIEAHANYYRFCEVCAEIGATPVFEYTSPKARIVLNYGVEDLILLHIRYTVSGEYFDDASLRHLASNWDIPVVDTYPLDNGVHAYLDNLDTAENMEGYVFQFANGDMVKAKCKWYLDLHRKIVFVRKVDIVYAVLNETLDDIKSFYNETKSYDMINKVEQIEIEVSRLYATIEAQVEDIFEMDSHLDRKSFAIKYNKHSMFSLLMAKYLGQDLKILGFLEKNYTDLFSNEQI